MDRLDLTKYDGHAPGPYSPAMAELGFYIRDANGRMIAHVCGSGETAYPQEEKLANAHLFADAPLLLAEDVELRAELEATKLRMANQNDDLGMEVVHLRTVEPKHPVIFTGKQMVDEIAVLKAANARLTAQVEGLKCDFEHVWSLKESISEECNKLEAQVEKHEKALDELARRLGFMYQIETGNESLAILFKEMRDIARRAREGE